MGYNENQFSLPRWTDLSVSRQGLFEDTFRYIPSVGWMFLPLTVYHGGGDAAAFEPLDQHLLVSSAGVMHFRCKPSWSSLPFQRSTSGDWRSTSARAWRPATGGTESTTPSARSTSSRSTSNFTRQVILSEKVRRLYRLIFELLFLISCLM